MNKFILAALCTTLALHYTESKQYFKKIVSIIFLFIYLYVTSEIYSFDFYGEILARKNGMWLKYLNVS